jgi:tRNA pseudouridine55 synthase
MKAGPPCGFLLLDKAQGRSSHQALSPCKRLFSERRAGHAGTLDPLATGLLFAAIGKATRLLSLAEGRDKEYLVAARLGIRTDTYDTDGAILSESPVPDSIDWPSLIAPWIGDIDQIPPAYSAISVDGVRAYDRARRGETVELPARRVRIDSVDLLEGSSPLAGTGWSPGDVTFRVRCSKGTYVRSLVRDLGEALGCGATVSALRRTAIGTWRLSDARPTDDREPELLAVEHTFPDLPRFQLDPADSGPFSHGHSVPSSLPDAEDALILDESGSALAWGRVREGRFQPKAMLV